jgi:hypothetical protein
MIRRLQRLFGTGEILQGKKAPPAPQALGFPKASASPGV